MLRRRISSLLADVTAAYRGTAVEITAILLDGGADDGDLKARKHGGEIHGKELELEQSGLIVLDESSDDDIFTVTTNQPKWLRVRLRGLYERTQLWQIMQGDVFVTKANATTCEGKYKVHPRVAEFWCTVTSPIYLLPLVCVYHCGGLYALPPTAHFALVSTFWTAMASGLYHTFNTEFLSLLDVILAFNTQLAFTICFLEDVTNRGLGEPVFGDFSLSSEEWLLVSMGGTAVLFSIFLISPWPQVMPLIAFAVLLPPTCLLLFFSGVYSTLILLCAGTVSYVIDRLGFFPAHSLWHFFSAGGLYTCLTAALHANEGCGVYNIPQST